MVDRGELDKNFHFVVLEVVKQVNGAKQSLHQPDEHLRRKIATRDDYINHLKSLIENKVFAHLRRPQDLTKKAVDRIRSMNVITANLERIADHAVNIAQQTQYFKDPASFQRYEYHCFFDVILEALQSVLTAFEQGSIAKGLDLCQSEAELDDLYRERFAAILRDMHAGGHPEELITSLFIFHYLERMGDCLKNIGEAVLFMKLGEKLKFDQIESLRRVLTSSETGTEPLTDAQLEGIWGTRSGLELGRVTEAHTEGAHEQGGALYKAGNRKKLRAEKQNIERWSELVPGLPPRILKYEEGDQDATLLIEYLNGSNFQELALHPSQNVLNEALTTLLTTVRDIWMRTKADRPARTGFIEQLEQRLEDVYLVHPNFRSKSQRIGELDAPNLDELLRQIRHLDDELTAPFAIFGHGDFNLDNLIYQPETSEVHFIDLHRSGEMDYVQDVSVFLVSNLRIPVFDPAVRERLSTIILRFYDFAQEFAVEQNDTTFNARLALGLSRSLITSTRFEFERSFAEDMFRRAIFLLQRLANHDQNKQSWEAFTLPREILV